MKNSRTSLNKPFYDWIKEVREADKKIKELEDKLYYYNVKLIGYNSPNFEPRLSSTKPEYKDNRYIWIEKILIIENKIQFFTNIKRDFIDFKNTLTEKEKIMIDKCFNDKNKLSLYQKNYYLNKLSRLHQKYFYNQL